MEQRPLRLGDVVDDYCPRERRLTNHVIVAIVDQAIRQTRCSTCDAEHEYKGARMLKSPKKRLKPGAAETVAEPAAGILVTPSTNETEASVAEPAAVVAVALEVETREATVEVSVVATNGEAVVDDVPDGWLAHRPLIRATLPRTEGAEPPARPIPEFTIHQRQGRSFHRGFRPGGNGNQGNHGSQGNHGNHGNHGNNFRDGNGPDGNRAPQPGKPGRRRRRRRR